MATIPARISAASGYFNGVRSESLEEVDLPEVEFGTTDVGNLGMSGTVAHVDPTDLQPMSATLKFRALSPEVAQAFGPNKVTDIDIRIAVADRTNGAVSTRANRAVMRATAMKLVAPTIQRTQEDLIEVEVSVQYYKLVLGDETVVEVDPDNFVVKFGADDAGADVRAIL